MKTKLTGILLAFLALTGCVKETLDKCPENNVRINVYAEKFQTASQGARQDVEEQFNKRIQFLRCILYQGNASVKDTTLENVSAVNGSHLSLDFPGLPFGNYQLVIMGNCAPDILQGDVHTPGGFSILYSGAETTDDLFAASLPFTVDCDCEMEFDTKLRRLQGVVRCQFLHLPDEVRSAEIILHNVNSSIGKENNVNTNKSIDITKQLAIPDSDRTNVTTVLGAFPTLSGQETSYELKLFGRNTEVPVFDQVLANDIRIVRNQLLELIADFSGGDIRFEVKINPQWDDHVDGGEVEVH